MSDAPIVTATPSLQIQRCRARLPDTAESITHHFNVVGNEGDITVVLYADARPGAIFIRADKEGSKINGLMNALGIVMSLGLQYGVPVDDFVLSLSHDSFEPSGMTTNPEIPVAKSLVDYVMRWLGIQFIPGYQELKTPQRRPR